MRILAIESSCDDSGVAILEVKDSQPILLADLVSSQIKIHAKWGGVVPMLAKREHQKNLTPLFKEALKEASLLQKHQDKPEDKKLQEVKKILEREETLAKKLIPFLKKYQKPDIDLIAVTVGPGLEPALWVGVNFARALAYFWNLPVLPVNHIEGHIAANSFQNKINTGQKFPAIALVVSGGHTQLLLVKDFGDYQILGETRDDAAGEAFDKVAKMLDLGYPGGPIISQLAQQIETKNYELITGIKFPRPMINSGDFDFSFSGLKTAVLYFIQKLKKNQIKKLTPAIAAQFQQAVIDVLLAKTLAAAQKYQAKTIMLSGGVAANDELRKQFAQKAQPDFNLVLPSKNFCTDNAAMVAQAAFLKIQKGEASVSWQNLQASPNLRLK